MDVRAYVYTFFFFLCAFCGFCWLFSGSVLFDAMRIYLSDLASELGGKFFFLLLCFLSFWGRERGRMNEESLFLDSECLCLWM